MSKGIDVSKWQGVIDFDAVKSSGIDFVIIRAGYGKESWQKDSYFERNYKNAKSAGLKVGAYWYSYAETIEEGKEYELEILDTFELDGESYSVFVPADIEDMDVNDPDYGLIFLRNREENGEEFFDSIDTDEELDRVYQYYQEILDAEEEE